MGESLISETVALKIMCNGLLFYSPKGPEGMISFRTQQAQIPEIVPCSEGLFSVSPPPWVVVSGAPKPGGILWQVRFSVTAGFPSCLTPQ